MKLSCYIGFGLSMIFLVNGVYSDALQLNGANFDTVVSNSELVFINFYAGWCRFSNMLEPIWNKFADKIRNSYNGNQVTVVKVDADTEKLIAMNNGINKYPTLKLYRYGVLVKKEYRGARTVEAFEQFIKDQLVSKLNVVETMPDLIALDNGKPTVLGYFANKDSENYKMFSKLANILRDRCTFIAAVGDQFHNERQQGDKIHYKEEGSDDNDPKNNYNGQLTDYNTLYAWAYERCTPTVRKITFENAEELTEGGLPFLIIFHKPDDTESVKVFETEVKRQLGHLLNTVLPVAADGKMFSHPLTHLGKSLNDLPVIAIDSFKHMYVFPENKKYTDGENLKQFVMDLNSGKLHREYHNGPDAQGLEMQMPGVQFEIVVNPNGHVPKIPEVKTIPEKRTNPPDSAFVKLAPSQDRYSVRHANGGEL